MVLLATLLAACDMSHRPLSGRASDEWNRTYMPSPAAELQIVGATGLIEVQGGTGESIQVRAERIVKAASNEAAAPLVSRVRISEDVTPEKIVLRSEGLGGVQIGVEVEVNFHVTAPASTRLRLHASDGDISLSNLDGAVVVSSTNGNLAGRALRGGVDARATNGSVTIDLAALSTDPVDLRSVNGLVQLTLPSTANANISAETTNGSIDLADLPAQIVGEQSTRRTRARLNAGGTPIELAATSGDIHVHPRP